jgi:hypothetical protein
MEIEIKKVFLSKEAIKKVEKNSRVREKIENYLAEIERLIKAKGKRPTEKIGKFNVSPRGHKNIRIAWHIERDERDKSYILYIDDFLYHEKEKEYKGEWIKGVEQGKITIDTYKENGYMPLTNELWGDLEKRRVEKYL